MKGIIAHSGTYTIKYIEYMEHSGIALWSVYFSAHVGMRRRERTAHIAHRTAAHRSDAVLHIALQRGERRSTVHSSA